MTENSNSDIKTALYDWHVAKGGKMVSFAGHQLPVQYQEGVMAEHVWVRQNAGLFDVSHMGQVKLKPKAGQNGDDVALHLEKLVPQDILILKPYRQRYCIFTNDQGGIIDDLMTARFEDHLFLVVNGACKAGDIAHMQSHIGQDVDIEVLEGRSLLALQGPRAAEALSTLIPEVATLKFMSLLKHEDMIIVRAGYTGEDGYEISLPNDQVEAFADQLCAHEAVKPIGLGARDSLRLEVGLCLYGNDLTIDTNPVEADLGWAMQKARKASGARAGGYLGADIVLEQIQNGASRKRVGLKPLGRAPMRPPQTLYADEACTKEVGMVTSGGFGPTVEHPVAMGYVSTELSGIGTKLYAPIRKKVIEVEVAGLPFTPQNYFRG